nr:unnamed protein product [Spirometra erinaceieuropaei]
MANPNEVRNKFYGDLHVLLLIKPKADKPTVHGDCDVCVGTDHAAWERFLCPYGIGDHNDNNLLLLQDCAKPNLLLLLLLLTSTFFHFLKWEKETWMHPSSRWSKASKLLSHPKARVPRLANDKDDAQCRRLDGSPLPRLQDVDSTATSQEATILSLILNIGLRGSFTWIFVITHVPRAILGSDFLDEFDVLVDCRRSRLLDRTTGLSVRGLTPFAAPTNLSVADTDVASRFRELLLRHPNIINSQFLSPPVFARPRRQTPERFQDAKAEFKHMLQVGIIRRSESLWASPLHMVPKATSDSGRPEDISKTAVTAPFGLFELIPMPSSLRYATQTFRRLIDHVLRGLPFVYAYIDDLLMASRNEKEQKEQLALVFDCLDKFGVVINPSKCVLGVPSLEFLDHVDSEALKSDLDCSAAELVFGTTLRLPGEMVTPTFRGTDETLNNFVHRLRQFLGSLSPVPPRTPMTEFYVEKDLDNCTHVFVRCDRVRQPLESPYEGKFCVLACNAKTCRILRVDKENLVSVDQVKAAVAENRRTCHKDKNLLTP